MEPGALDRQSPGSREGPPKGMEKEQSVQRGLLEACRRACQVLWGAFSGESPPQPGEAHGMSQRECSASA